MGTLTRALSKKSKPKTSAVTPNATSLQALADGRLPFASLGGAANQSGPGAAPVPRLASRVKEKRAHDAKARILSQALQQLATSFASHAATHGWPMPDIFGRSGGVFYAMPDPVARSLENRLRQRLAGHGSPLYALRWRSWTMVLGAPIFALRASERTTSGNAFTGWPTPKTVTGGANSKRAERKAGGADLQEVAHLLTGWPTPNTMGGGQTSRGGKRKDELLLGGAVKLLAGWTTPQTRDHKDGATTLDNTPVNGMLSRQVTMLVVPGSMSRVPMVDLGPYLPTGKASLNPRFSLWLILGPYATAWARCAERVMRLTRN